MMGFLVASSDSDFVWVVNTDNNTAYRRNTVTKEYEEVAPNIVISRIDISQDGHVVALDEKGQLYLWNEATGSFDTRSAAQSFEDISIGDNALWATADGGSTLNLWDEFGTDFSEVDYPGSNVVSIAVAKEGDAFYVADDNGRLWQYEYPQPPDENGEQGPGTWIVLSDDFGVDNLEQLRATDEGKLWARDGDGQIYQLNISDSEDPSDQQTTFIPKSDELNLDPVSDFAIDQSGAVYGITEGGLTYAQTEPALIQTDIADETSAVALGTDANGRTHYVFSDDGGVFHSYLENGEWVNATYIAGSGRATELKVDFDDIGNVYISWVQAEGYDSEVFVSKGVGNSGFAGYTFSQAAQVTDDDVTDSNLDLAVTPDGQVSITVNKQDFTNRFDDSDIYHYTLDGNGNQFVVPSDFGVSDFNDAGKSREINAIDGFTFEQDVLQSNFSTALFFPSAVGTKLTGYGFDGGFFANTNYIRDSDGYSFVVGLSASAGFNAAEIIPVPFIRELKLSGFLNSAGGVGPDGLFGQTSLDWRISFAVDLSGNVPKGNNNDFGIPTLPGNVGYGLFAQVEFEQVLVSSDSEANFFFPVTLTDSDGEPLTTDTPPSDAQASYSTNGLLAWALNGLVPGASGSEFDSNGRVARIMTEARLPLTQLFQNTRSYSARPRSVMRLSAFDAIFVSAI